MSLTLKVENMLVAVKLVEFFDDEPVPWLTVARATYQFLVLQFPKGATIRRDDVAIALIPLLEVHKGLGSHLLANKLTQKYWIRNFADLIVDRAWATITT